MLFDGKMSHVLTPPHLPPVFHPICYICLNLFTRGALLWIISLYYTVTLLTGFEPCLYRYSSGPAVYAEYECVSHGPQASEHTAHLLTSSSAQTGRYIV